MGTASSVSNSKKPDCPYQCLRAQKRLTAQKAKYVDGQVSKLYSLCRDGETHKVSEMLNGDNRELLENLNKLEPNGDTALHAATRSGHASIVKLLLDHKCDRTLINRDGKIAAEEAGVEDMQQLFKRPADSSRFYAENFSDVTSVYVPEDEKAAERYSAQSGTTTEDASRTGRNASERVYVRSFKNKEEIYEYCLNQQTMAMWMQFYDWFFRKFPTVVRHDYLKADTFDLDKSPDFQEFLHKQVDEDKREETVQAILRGKKEKSIAPLINVYTRETAGLYGSLNRQLSHSAADPDLSPHLCDRFIMEFYIHRDQLEERSYLGKVYRGGAFNVSDLSIYEQAINQKHRSVIGFNTFTSTSETKDVALNFIIKNPPGQDQLTMLLVITIKELSPTIIGIADLSVFEDEEEVLIMPGNLFTVQKIKKDVIHQRLGPERPVTEIHLEQHHLSVSFGKKLLHTIRSARKPDV